MSRGAGVEWSFVSHRHGNNAGMTGRNSYTTGSEGHNQYHIIDVSCQHVELCGQYATRVVKNTVVRVFYDIY
jgi:hypothetical protein